MRRHMFDRELQSVLISSTQLCNKVRDSGCQRIAVRSRRWYVDAWDLIVVQFFQHLV